MNARTYKKNPISFHDLQANTRSLLGGQRGRKKGTKSYLAVSQETPETSFFHIQQTAALILA